MAVTKLMLVVAMLGGCATYFGDDGDVEPDAAVVAPPDAKECGFTLPRCVDLDPRCATGETPTECPREEDKTVCWCPSKVTAPGWCISL